MSKRLGSPSESLEEPSEDGAKAPSVPRKKVSRSKRVKRPRRRREERAIASTSNLGTNSESAACDDQISPSAQLPPLGLTDPDLMECVLSDDEERTAFLAAVNATCGHLQCQDDSHTDDVPSLLQSHSTVLSESQTVNSGENWSRSGSPLSLSNPSPASSTARPLSPFSPSLLSDTCEFDGTLSFREVRGALTLDLTEEINSESTAAASEPVPNEEYSESNVSTMPASSLSQRSAVSADNLEEFSEYSPPLPLIEEGLVKFKSLLPRSWFPVADHSGFHLLLLSEGPQKAIQRDVFVSFLGVTSISVHCKPLIFASDLISVDLPPVQFVENSLSEFCSRAHQVVQNVMQYKVCVGADNEEFQDVWENIPYSCVDTNPYQENSYKKTCRSLSCQMLVKLGKTVRCSSCTTVMKSLKKRVISLRKESPHPSTPNVHLSKDQILAKLQLQSEELKRSRSKIAYLTGKISKLLEDEGVDLDEDLSSNLYDILTNTKLSNVQRMFLQEQLSSVSKADPRAHRWHPSMIRLALHLYMLSPAAYEAMRDSGAIKLPCARTLFDYSHAFDPQAGISEGLLKIAKKTVSSRKEQHQKFVALIADEMHISKNLVYRPSDGQLMGYVHLNEVEKEIMHFEHYLNGKESEPQKQLASKVLTYMVKGLSSKLKCVVACYPCSQLTKDMMYCRSWEVISRLERSGIKVLAFVSDGSSINRAFIAMHQPLTKTRSGVVFDTLNLCSPDGRPLFFIADVAHLMKTIRNCFYNSGVGEKKVRCLEFNGQKIEWKTIIRLYLTYKQCNFRKSFKLNSQNVFPNSYSCMSVKHAVHVLSETVATDIEMQKWSDTEETVSFIRRWNKFFDCLNGLYHDEHIRKRNADLAPYKTVDDPRFDWLESCVVHLEEWRKQARELHVSLKVQEKSMLSCQTQEGIEMAVRGFTGATKYLLNEGKAPYVMGRAFSQDHLENYFSRQRGKGGGSSNPNVSQFLAQSVSMAIQSETGVRRKKSNVQQLKPGMEVTNEPLPKRQKTKK